ncbi:MAG: LysR family transcriptional regulator [Duodenibacillus sp.]|nr:LysR family transcriptional regulator [Duodenibacillus sp.]
MQPAVRAILEAAGRLAEGSFVAAECTRTFRISSMMTEVGHVIGGVLPMMLAEAPGASLALQRVDNEFAAVFEGAVDFAIVTEERLPPEAHFLKLYPLDRVVLMRRQHPLARLGRPLLLEDLQDCRRVTIRTGRSSYWTGPDQDLFPNERAMQRTAFATSRFYAAWEAMERCDLISVCGWRAAEIAMRGHDLVALPLPSDFKEKNRWNVLMWADSRHRDEDCVWLRRIFARWAVEEERRVRALYEAGRWIPGRKPRALAQPKGSSEV